MSGSGYHGNPPGRLALPPLLRVAPPRPAGLGGGSASGKTTVARMIIEALDVPWVVLLSMDSFYKVRSLPAHAGPVRRGAWSPCPCHWHSVEGRTEPLGLPLQVLTTQQQEQAARNNFNFDHPDAFDFDLIVSTLKKLKQGKSVKVPVYDFTTHSRKKDWVGPLGSARAHPPGSMVGTVAEPPHGSFAENALRCKRHHLRRHHGLC